MQPPRTCKRCGHEMQRFSHYWVCPTSPLCPEVRDPTAPANARKPRALRHRKAQP